MMTISKSEIYNGQFGNFTITKGDCRRVMIYRISLMLAAVCFLAGSYLVLQYNDPTLLRILTWLYAGFSIFLGVSLSTIRIYITKLHNKVTPRSANILGTR